MRPGRLSRAWELLEQLERDVNRKGTILILRAKRECYRAEMEARKRADDGPGIHKAKKAPRRRSGG
ncbi:MAG: hypothetical protein JRD89_01235 [Deltaproteobacteria bacterium]|nr:hypothetical protein [Deltaproteobacteria bacterium]